MTIKDLISNASLELKDAGILSSELDARVLLKHALDTTDSWLIRNDNFPITNSEYSKFRNYIRKRKMGIAVAYIVHEKEFYGHRFYINKNVLIPRPETEHLVEEALDIVKGKKLRSKKYSIIDVGTGSGAIIISLLKACEALEAPEARYYASDISKKALAVARKNAKLHKVNKKIRFFNSDLFSNKRLPKKFDLIIANLPYVPSSNVKNLPDPGVSLDGGEDGLDIVYKFLDQAKDRINNEGTILMEIGFNQSKKVMAYTKKISPKAKVSAIKDLQSIERIIKIEF